ncbi:MAG: methyltransferase domain-containing protein [Vicinamibacterales bacterium]
MIVPFTRGRGLDIGCGPYKAWPHFIGLDDHSEYGGINYRPDIQGDCFDLSLFADKSLDFVFSSHLLEHVEDTEKALSEWWRVVKPDGHLVLYLPHKELYPNIGEPGGNEDHKHDFMPEDIVEVMKRVGSWDLVHNEKRAEGMEYSFLQIYRKMSGSKHHESWRELPTEKRCLVIRYGAFGDNLQASSVLPGLKEQGWHVTYQTTPRGHEVVREDPHIDAFWVQDNDQVPNDELGPYWNALRREFDHVINLSEATEGSLLTIPGRIQHVWPHAARHRALNVDYLQLIHDIADVAGEPKMRFYPTELERAQLKKFRDGFGKVPVVMWSLAGSSIHKVWPWTDQAVSYLLRHTDAVVVFCGGPQEQILEQSIVQNLLFNHFNVTYEESNELKLSGSAKLLNQKLGGRRVIFTSGQWSIRQSLTFVEYADCIVGPETGVLNAAGMLEVPKVVMLSHSSQENLTQHWKNTTAIEPVGVGCFPCHQMHYGRDFCPEHKDTGAALCAASIQPDRVFKAIADAIYPAKAAAGD